jgi:hypothetical protein
MAIWGMPKRISKKLTDPNQIAAAVVGAATSDTSESMRPALYSQVMAEMGRKGGKIGGKRSLETMSSSDRKKRAKKAAQARWKKPAK